MSTTTKDRYEGEERHDWHALPGLIGDMISQDEAGHIACGGYLVERDEDGDLFIYRELDMAGSEEDLAVTGDKVFAIWDGYTANELVASIPAPVGGWGDEVEELPESIWGGFD